MPDHFGPIVLACRCSGHAFKFGPALGPLVAAIVEGKPSSTAQARPAVAQRQDIGKRAHFALTMIPLQSARANPAKVAGFVDKDLLQHIVLARFLIGEVIPLRGEAR
jgi:hypothetical protein